MEAIVIPAAVLEDVRRRAAASPDTEVCGLLFGTAARIDAAAATRNVADDPATRFEIDPAMLIAAYRAEREGGVRVIGHYHSHPRGPAVPSAQDRAMAEPGRLWLIVGAGDARLWRSEMAEFRELALAIR